MILNSTLPNTLGTLTINNPGAGGEAWLIVTNAAVSNALLSLGTGGRLQIDNGGSVTNFATTSLVGPGAQIFVNAGGTFANGTNGTVSIGAGGRTNQIVVSGLVTNVALLNIGINAGGAVNTATINPGGQVYVGNYAWVGSASATATNNTLIVNGGLLSCGGNVQLANSGSVGDNLYVTNNGQVVSGNGFVGGASGGQGSGNGFNCLALVRDGGLWNLTGNTLYIGRYGGTGNVVTIDVGGVISNASVAIGDAGAGAVYGWGNRLTVTNGGKFYGVGTLAVANKTGSSNNVFEVVGDVYTSVVVNAGAITVGNGAGGYNTMTARKANISSVGLAIGYAGGSNNTVTVGDNVTWNLGGGTLTWGSGGTGNVFSFISDSQFTNIGGVSMGDIGTRLSLGSWNLSPTNALNVGTAAGLGNNSLTLSNQNYTSTSASTIGSGSSNNVLTVSANTIWNGGAQTITVGSSGGTGNQLALMGGGMITNVGVGIIVGTGAGSSGNSVLVDGSSSKVFVSGGKSTIGGANASSNTVTLQNGAFWDNKGYGWAIGGGTNSIGNALAMNGAVMSNGAVIVLGYAGDRNFGNSFAISNGSTYTGKGFTLDGSNNTFQIGGPGLPSSAFFGTTLSLQGDSCKLILTNASLYAHTTPGGSTVGNSSSNCTFEIRGGGSADLARVYVGQAGASFNTLTVNGGTVTEGASATDVGYGSGAGASAVGNQLVITNGGQYYVTTLLQVGNSAGDSNNSVVVGSGGLLGDTGSGGSVGWTVLSGSTGNAISNVGGTYEFAHSPASITITPNGSGTVSITSGTMSFKGISNANITNNWSGSFTNMSFYGVNTYRLNNATNLSAPRFYTFDTNLGATNYAGMELVNGPTAYGGTPGTNNSVLITTNGWLTFSNTTATMWGSFTNNGTLNVVDSTVTFKQNLTLGEKCNIMWASNSIGSSVTVNGKLTLPNAANLTIPTTIPQGGAFVLFTSTNTISGSVANWSLVGRPDLKVEMGVNSTQVVVRPKALGFIFKVM